MVRNVITPLLVIDRISRQKISKSLKDLKNSQLIWLIDIFTVFHPKITGYTFFQMHTEDLYFGP